MFCLAKLQVQTAFVFNDVLKKTKHDLMFCLVAGYTQALSLQEPCVIYYCTPKYVLGIPGFHSLGSLSILEDSRTMSLLMCVDHSCPKGCQREYTYREIARRTARLSLISSTFLPQPKSKTRKQGNERSVKMPANFALSLLSSLGHESCPSPSF